VRIHCLLPLFCVLSAAGQPVSITVHANETDGPFRPIFRYFGYDEPNYTYAPNGRKLVGELAAVSAAPTYIRPIIGHAYSIRCHFLHHPHRRVFAGRYLEAVGGHAFSGCR
jgi:hypothetical protein